MASSFRRSLAFGPLRVHSPRSSVPLSAAVRGARVAFGPRGTYVAFGAGRFHYRVKFDDTVGQEVSPVTAPLDVVAHDVETRARRAPLFKIYCWVAGVLLVFSIGAGAAFVVLLVLAIVAGFFVRRWDRERRTARVFYDVDNDEIVGRLALCNVAGEALARTARLWHMLSSTPTHDRKYHAGATGLVSRTPVRCGTGLVDGIDLNVDCWSVSDGARELLFLPDRLLVRQGKHCMSVTYDGLSVSHETTQFVEEQGVPPDSRVIDTTWRFVNKSGGPDLRFKNNAQLPVVAYGRLTLVSATGLHVVMQSSNPLATQSAAAALQELARIAREPASLPAVPAPWAAPPALHPQPLAPASVPRPAYGPISPPVAPIASPPSTLQQNAWGHPPRSEPQPQRVQHAPPPYAPATPPLRPIASAGPPLPPPPPFLRARPRTAVHVASSTARFVGVSEPLTVAGRTIATPLTYVAAGASYDTDASTIVTSLPVGHASRALPLPYWPRYSEADPDQRARYLDWMAAGRVAPNIPVGYAFIFFYGLERRVLVDGADEEIARAEVRRLLGIYGESRSFRRYASDFLAFTPLRHTDRLVQMSAAEVTEKLRPLAADSATALAVIAAWHHVQRRPLAAEYAALVARSMENAKRGAVVTRSAVELLDLFSIRYRDAFGDGLLLEAAKRPLTIEYHPASATLLEDGRAIKATLPDVLGRASQFRKVVAIWNDCVDDLRKANTRKGGAKQLDAAAWSALPAELRAEYDHPDQDKWDVAIAATPVLAGFHLVQVGQLAELAGIEPSEKVTTAQMKKLATRAADVGYAMEPEPRLRSKATEWSSEALIWRVPSDEVPEAKVYGAVFGMLSLAMTVAMADGVFTREEQDVVNSFLAELFTLDEGMRTRVEAMKQLMARDPSRLGVVAKTLKATRTPAELAKVAAVLVAIAAADGTIAETEEKALRSLYRSLGLPAGDLAATMARTGARLERDRPVEVQRATAGAGGVPIPPPPDAAPKLRLDQAAIDAIVADTKEVAAILAEVFDAEADEPTSAPAPSMDASDARPAVVELPRASEATTALARGLDVRYHAVLEELLTEPEWTAADVRRMAERHRLMPGAILDTINAWSDDVLGDFLIEDAGAWKVNRELARGDA